MSGAKLNKDEALGKWAAEFGLCKGKTYAWTGSKMKKDEALGIGNTEFGFG